MNIESILLGVIGGIFLFLIILFILKKIKGSIKIIPEKYSYSPGEDIKGKVILKFKKPVSAEKLTIGLICEKHERTYSSKTQTKHKEDYLLFDFKYPLEEKKEYVPGEYSYDFLIKGPNNFSKEIEGVAGTLVKSVQILTGRDYSLKWYLCAHVECKGVDLSKKVQINIV